MRTDEGPIEEANEAVEPDKPQEEIRQDPYPLLRQFEYLRPSLSSSSSSWTRTIYPAEPSSSLAGVPQRQLL